MSDWKTHFIFSLFLVIIWISIFYFADLNLQLRFESLIVLIALTVFASLFPDVDMKRSKIRDAVSFMVAALAAATYLFFYIETWYYGPAYFVLLYLILKYLPTKHRGIAHTFKFSILFSIALGSTYFLFNPFMFEELVFWSFIVFSSYNLHLILDRM